MKRTTIIFFALLALAACKDDKSKPQVETTVAAASTGTASAAAPMPDSATMEKNWQVYMTPGTEHQQMAKWNGRWNAEVTMWESASAKPFSATMQAKNEMILGGRYQRSLNTGKMMGMDFEGISVTAYDNARKMFISNWIDNMGTGIMNMEGTWDEATKTINFTGKAVNPKTYREENVRETFTIMDDDHQLLQMYSRDADGKEYKSMQIHYTKQK
ncbi:MAG: hypothetical protein JWP27_1237 [Flaviaesturariibacter sp.]|nr:hypothetical protein [Flaviaesturariibacter sp.]